MSITSELVDTLFETGLATSLPVVRRRITDFLSENESETKRLQMKINGNTTVFLISKIDKADSRVFEAYVSEDKLEEFTICLNEWSHTWNQEAIANAIGYVLSGKDVKNFMFDVVEEVS